MFKPCQAVSKDPCGESLKGLDTLWSLKCLGWCEPLAMILYQCDVNKSFRTNTVVLLADPHSSLILLPSHTIGCTKTSSIAELSYFATMPGFK